MPFQTSSQTLHSNSQRGAGGMFQDLAQILPTIMKRFTRPKSVSHHSQSHYPLPHPSHPNHPNHHNPSPLQRAMSLVPSTGFVSTQTHRRASTLF